MKYRKSFAKCDLRSLFFASLLFWWGSNVEADFLAYTSRAGFDAGAGASLAIQDFEAFSVGNIPSGTSLDGIQFNYTLGSVSLRVVDNIVTTSGSKSLGSDDRDMLADGDSLDFSFSPRTGFGFYVISRDALINGDIRLTAGGVEASLLASASQINLGAGGLAWFLGVQSNDGATLTSASLSTHGGGGQFNFNMDDFASVLAVPEPSSFWLLAMAAGMGFRYRDRSRRR